MSRERKITGTYSWGQVKLVDATLSPALSPTFSPGRMLERLQRCSHDGSPSQRPSTTLVHRNRTHTPNLRGNEALNLRAAECVPIVDRPARGIALLPLAAATATMGRLSSVIGCSVGNPVACDDSWIRESRKATACPVDVVSCYSFQVRIKRREGQGNGEGIDSARNTVTGERVCARWIRVLHGRRAVFMWRAICPVTIYKYACKRNYM